MSNVTRICVQCNGSLSRNNSSGTCQKCKSDNTRIEDTRNRGMLCSSCKEKPRKVYANGTVSPYCVDCKSKITSYKDDNHCITCNKLISRSADTGYCSRCYAEQFRKGDQICPICCARKRHMFPTGRLASYCAYCLNEKSKERRVNSATRYSILKIGWKRGGMVTTPTKDQYEKMLQETNGVCPACGREPENKELGLILHHNHETGEWIGLLCSHCNAALGYMGDSAELLKRLCEYAKEKYIKLVNDLESD